MQGQRGAYFSDISRLVDAGLEAYRRPLTPNSMHLWTPVLTLHANCAAMRAIDIHFVNY